MHERAPFFSLPVVSLVLALLLSLVVGPSQTATAQKVAFNVDDPLTSLQQAPATSDSQRVALATALLRARAYGEIDRSTYEDGVWYFLENHPGFYGNFFGDPFYATYDIRYFRLVQMRWLAELEIDPHGESSITASFFCDPFSYDPAYGGRCLGLRYGADEFFLVPSIVTPPTRNPTVLANRRSSSSRIVHQEARTNRQSIPDSLHTPDLPPHTSASARTSPVDAVAIDEEPTRSAPLVPVTPVEEMQPSGQTRQLQLPDNLYTSMEETASSLKRNEVAFRIRQLMSRRYGNRALSAQEQAQFATRLAETLSEDRDLLPQLRALSQTDNYRGATVEPNVLKDRRSEIRQTIRHDRSEHGSRGDSETSGVNTPNPNASASNQPANRSNGSSEGQ